MTILAWLFCLLTLNTIFSSRVLQHGGFFDRLVGFLQAVMLIAGFFVFGWKLGLLCFVVYFLWSLAIAGLIAATRRRLFQP